jgi:chromosomal replication initiator protein
LISGLYSLPIASADAAGVAVRDGGDHCAEPRETFCAGPENALVRALVAAVDSELIAYNPIVIFGPAGSGKSTLAHALAARRRMRFGLNSVIAVTGAELAHSLANAVDSDAVADHRARHQRCDLWLVDDLHRLASKPAAQQFLLSTLDALIRRGTQVIFTLRQSPQATAGLSPQLVSRLLGGLVVGLALPGQLARRELVRQQAERLQLPLRDDEISRLAGCADGETARYLTATHLRQVVLRHAADAEFGSEGAAAFERSPDDAKVVCRRISGAVARHFGLTLGDLRGKSRQQTTAEARGLAMYLTRRLTAASYAQIGQWIGGRDHTTVLHACRKFTKLVGRDEFTRRTAEELAAQVAAEGVT